MPALLTGGLVLLALPRCQPALEPYQTERFELVAGPAAAEGYPMEIEEGRFPTSDGNSIPFGAEFLEGDWGLSHSVVVRSDGTAPAPDSLEVRWFSYTEDKFYQGRWAMPQRRIHELLRQGYWNTDEQQHATYSNLTMCLLPQGVVVVWLCGRNQVLLGRYQAREINFDFKRFNPAANRPRMIAQEQARLPAAVQAQIRSGTLSSRRWDDCLTTYRWRLALRPPLRLLDYGLSYVNAETDNYPRTAALALPRATALLATQRRPVPSNLLLRVEAGPRRHWQLQVKALDEAETRAAFQTLHAAHPVAPLTLGVETDASMRQARLVLQNDWQRVVLHKSTVVVYAVE
ncbi:DUF2931 family protein [Hymenobacter nivis]|uniref:DUF2931 family protein n=1 Tax=Hymenobacter nivis TaxID=1850093 RepID=UPI0013762856|nr:DUF2931 family protein [Hymenobacter nivis]